MIEHRIQLKFEAETNLDIRTVLVALSDSLRSKLTVDTTLDIEVQSTGEFSEPLRVTTRNPSQAEQPAAPASASSKRR
jgi:hypothetical protein